VRYVIWSRTRERQATCVQSIEVDPLPIAIAGHGILAQRASSFLTGHPRAATQ